MSFSTQSHAESVGNYIKNQVLGPQQIELNQNMPIWARPGPLKSGKSSEKTHFMLSNTFFAKIVVLDLQTMFFDGKTMFFKFLAEIRLRPPIKSPQKPSFRPNRAIFIPPAPCLKLQSGTTHMFFYITHCYQKSPFLSSTLRFLMVLACS